MLLAVAALGRSRTLRSSWTRQAGVFPSGPGGGGWWRLGGMVEPRPAAWAKSSAPSMVNSARVRPNPMMSRFIVDPPRWGVLTWRFIVDPPGDTRSLPGDTGSNLKAKSGTAGTGTHWWRRIAAKHAG